MRGESSGPGRRLRLAIIGAGPAGSAAAIHLARAGHRVTIIEARAFPRAKVCGEYISPAGTAALEAVIPPAELLAAGARRVDLFAIDHGARSIEWRAPRPAWAISRGSLDAMLLERAAEAGAEVVQPCAVRGVSYGPGGVLLDTAAGEIGADAVIHADGSGRHDPSGPTPRDGELVGHKAHLRPPGGVRGVRMRPGRGAYVGTIEVEGGLCTAALVARRGVIGAYGGDGDAMLAGLWPGYEPSWREGAWMSCPVPRAWPVRPGHERSVRLGNAAAATDPVGGEGIGNALWSAGVFARALARTGSVSLAAGRVTRAYRLRLATRLVSCWAAAELLMRPGLVGAVWPVLSSGPAGGAALGAWYRLSGKPWGGGDEKKPRVLPGA